MWEYFFIESKLCEQLHQENCRLLDTGGIDVLIWIHNKVSYMIYLPKHHLDLVDDMYDIQVPQLKYISPKISFVGRLGIR